MNDYWKNRKAGKRGQGEKPVLNRWAAEQPPRFYAQNRRGRRSKLNQLHDPVRTKKAQPAKSDLIKDRIRQRVLRIEETRHLHSLAKKGLL